MKGTRWLYGILSCTLFLGFHVGCAKVQTVDVEAVDADAIIRQVIQTKNLTGDPATGRDIPKLNTPLAQLGKHLYYAKSLSIAGDVACATCHHPFLAGGDAMSLGVGVDAVDENILGPGRLHSPDGKDYDGGPTIPRHAPTAFNAIMWDKHLTWDGRIEALNPVKGANGSQGGIRTPESKLGTPDPRAGSNLSATLVRFPVVAPLEMMGFGFHGQDAAQRARVLLADRIAGREKYLKKNNWLPLFRKAFNKPRGSADELITFPNIVEAVGAFQSSMAFTNTPWKAYVQGDKSAISQNAKKGAVLFFLSSKEGGFGCATCHSGDFFTDEKFYNTAMIQVGPGAQDFNGKTYTADVGRWKETPDRSDMYAFRTMTLLNVEMTGPWGHAGAYTTLEGVVRQQLNPAKAFREYNPSQLEPNVQTQDWKINSELALLRMRDMRRTGRVPMDFHEATDQQVSYLVEFLKTLTDPCLKDRACLAKWVPGKDEEDPDGTRLYAKTADGRKLY